MAIRSTRQRNALDHWGPKLFLVGGGLIVGHAAIRGAEAFTDLAVPPDLFAPAGYLLALLGMLGLYPSLAGRTPRLARAAVVVAALPLAGWLVMLTWSVGELAGALPPQSAVLPGAFYAGHLVTLILTYLLFGVATLRAGVHSRTVGVLLLSPSALFVVMIVGAAVLGNGGPGPFVVGSALALVHLSIGVTLQRGAPTGDETPAADATAG